MRGRGGRALRTEAWSPPDVARSDLAANASSGGEEGGDGPRLDPRAPVGRGAALKICEVLPGCGLSPLSALPGGLGVGGACPSVQVAHGPGKAQSRREPCPTRTFCDGRHRLLTFSLAGNGCPFLPVVMTARSPSVGAANGQGWGGSLINAELKSLLHLESQVTHRRARHSIAGEAVPYNFW